jgi:hypothetical protein
VFVILIVSALLKCFCQDIFGVNAEDVQIDFAVQVVLINTVKACLVTDETLRRFFNVSIDSVSDDARRLGAVGLRRKSIERTLSNAQIKYSVSFDVDKQQYQDSSDGYSQMTTTFMTSVGGGLFTQTMRASAGSNSVLSTATGATTVASITPASVKYVQLLYPSMSPTVSCRPTVTPTQLPTTRTPTRVPTTTAPTVTPTTVAPTAMPTFKTSKMRSFDLNLWCKNNSFQ